MDLSQLKPIDLSRMFPSTPLSNIAENLPFLVNAFNVAGFDREMVRVALATIRAECASFTPESEGVSRYNTSGTSHPFDLYDKRTDLGNFAPPDGERFRGRGYVQLTGKANYRKYAAELGIPLDEQPELANQPDIAARILCKFLADHEITIRHALIDGDFPAVRRAVNGGSHGLAPFLEAFQRGEYAIPA